MVYIAYTHDLNRNPDEEEYARANNITEARKLAVRILERTHHRVYITQVDRYSNNAYPWYDAYRGRKVGKVSAINYTKHSYQVWTPQNGNGQQMKMIDRNGNLGMTFMQFDKFMHFHIEESLEF